MSTPLSPLAWEQADTDAVSMLKALAADAVDKAGHGHPGTAISLAPAAYTLFNRVMRHDPADPTWPGRDRFVLSIGHSSLTLYLQLFLSGYGLELEDLEKFRTFGSRTPGHPELGHTPGVEMTTGPLGQGVASAVGMAMAARRERGLFDPDAPAGQSPFDHTIFAFCGDGDMQEGISHEACSLAGTQQLGNLVLIYDDNHISIEDDTKVAFTEDVLARFEAYGWHTQRVNWLQDDGSYTEDVSGFYDAVTSAMAHTSQPSIIALRTIIGWPAPTLAGTGAIHGSKMGAEETAGLKRALGLDPDRSFAVDPATLAHAREVAARGASAHAAWNHQFADWRVANPQRAQLWDRASARQLPADIADQLPVFAAGTDLATRAASGKVLSALAAPLPELWGGSADLAGSNNTTMAGEPSFLPAGHDTAMWKGGPYGRTLHFGVREHAMGAIVNGIVLHGPTRAYGGTFMVFSDYMRPAVRLAALMGIPSTYVWTHDSVGVGEDGPTHQPIEHLAVLRAIPGLDVVRPADANETAAAWLEILRRTDRPAGLVLTRQNVPTFPRGQEGFADTSQVGRGAYVLLDTPGTPDVILMGTGSEVQVAVAARELLAAQGVGARVVSMPCQEWFDEQDCAYRDLVLPPAVTARVSVEAGLALGWGKYVGAQGHSVSIETFGAVGSASELMEHFGITADAVAAAALHCLGR